MHGPGLVVERKNVTFLRLLSGLAIGTVDENRDATHVNEPTPLAQSHLQVHSKSSLDG